MKKGNNSDTVTVNLVGFFIFCASWSILVYLAFSFVIGSFNVMSFGVDARLAMAVLIVLSILIGIASLAEDEEKNNGSYVSVPRGYSSDVEFGSDGSIKAKVYKDRKC